MRSKSAGDTAPRSMNAVLQANASVCAAILRKAKAAASPKKSDDLDLDLVQKKRPAANAPGSPKAAASPKRNAKQLKEDSSYWQLGLGT